MGGILKGSVRSYDASLIRFIIFPYKSANPGFRDLLNSSCHPTIFHNCHCITIRGGGKHSIILIYWPKMYNINTQKSNL